MTVTLFLIAPNAKAPFAILIFCCSTFVVIPNSWLTSTIGREVRKSVDAGHYQGRARSLPECALQCRCLQQIPLAAGGDLPACGVRASRHGEPSGEDNQARRRGQVTWPPNAGRLQSDH